MNLHEPRRTLLAAVAAAVLATASVAQCQPPQWFEANAYPGVDGNVYASTIWDPDGAGPLPPALAIGGNFRLAGTADSRKVAWWDGTSWHALGAGLGVVGEVWALTVFNGDLIASGFIGTSGVARWNGTAWQAMGSGGAAGTNNVLALAVYGGELYAGGTISPYAVTKWTGSDWQLIPGSGLGAVATLVVHNGRLACGGALGILGGVNTWDGAVWSPLGTLTQFGAAFNGGVIVLAVHNGTLIAGGAFTAVDGVPANYIARWTGSAWQAVGAGFTDAVLALGVWNGSLVASTGGTNPAALTPSVVARWSGVAWQTLGTSTGGRVRSLADFGGGLFAFGEFEGIGGILAQHGARWNGASWSRLNPGLNYSIETLASHGGDLIAGGSFTIAGSVEASGIARFDGAAWHALGSGLLGPLPYFPHVGAFATYNGDLIAGGTFASAGGVPAVNVARWDGSSWHSFGAGLNGGGITTAEIQAVVRALAVYNGELIAAGYITDSGGAPLASIARWNGTSWQPLGTGLNGPVHALCVHNGELVAGGFFSVAGGVPVSNVARWNGASWQAAGLGTTGVVHSLCTYGADLVAGGAFAAAGGLPASGVARWDGAAWIPFPLVGNNGVRKVAVFDGELFATSLLWALPSGLTFGIARWTGSAWESVGSGLTTLNPPSSTFPQPGFLTLAAHRGSLFVAGEIAKAGSLASPLLARWATPLPLLSVSQPGGSGSVLIDNAWLVPGHEYFNLASTDVCPGGPGTGPYGGLCANDPMMLWHQINVPLGTPPWHFAAAGTTASFGPYPLPPGFAFEAITVDLVGTAPCVSAAVGHTVY